MTLPSVFMVCPSAPELGGEDCAEGEGDAGDQSHGSEARRKLRKVFHVFPLSVSVFLGLLALAGYAGSSVRL